MYVQFIGGKTSIKMCKTYLHCVVFQGARACFLRDIPFSGIYFPTYAHLKEYFKDESGYTGAGGLFAAAMIAGKKSAFCCLP